MCKPFIRNHQYNLIKKQARNVQYASKTVADPRVMEAIRYSAETQILEGFPSLTSDQRQLLEKVSVLHEAEDLQQYLNSLTPNRVAFSQVTETQLRKLFPKNKKLKLPDFSSIDFLSFTYLSWLDIALNKMFLVYNLDDQIVGIEGKYIPTNKKDVCSLCKGHGEVALVTALTKSKPANASVDYYKAVGNYMCINSEKCNDNITDVTYLERFIKSIIR
nr:FusB/FusC family EF-G-binding protein [Ammoniphilus sp. YIM 78166]